MVEWKGKKRLACRNGLLEMDLIEGLVLYPTGPWERIGLVAGLTVSACTPT